MVLELVLLWCLTKTAALVFFFFPSRDGFWAFAMFPVRPSAAKTSLHLPGRFLGLLGIVQPLRGRLTTEEQPEDHLH